jgi:hypothetical protein
MSDYSQLIREYIRASEALLKADGLTDEERNLIDEVLTRISSEVLFGYVCWQWSRLCLRYSLKLGSAPVVLP